MRFGVCKRMHVAAQTFRAWPVWALPHGLAVFIVLLTAVYAAALGFAASVAHVHPWDLFVFAVLMLCIATTVELTKRAGENAGVIKDVWGVWELPIAILLPPVSPWSRPLSRSPWLSTGSGGFQFTGGCSRRLPSAFPTGLPRLVSMRSAPLCSGQKFSSIRFATHTLRWLDGC